MKGRTICLDHLDGREAAALIVDGQLDDLLVDDPDRPRPGAIFRAICDRPMKGQGGMTLRLPDGDSAFLRGASGLAPGQALLVQVTGYGEEGKAVPVTDRILFKSRYVIVTPGKPGRNVSRQIKDEDAREALLALTHQIDLPEGAGVILRSSAEGADPEEVLDDMAAMADLAAAVLGDAEGTEPEALTEGDGPHATAWREWTAPAEVDSDEGSFETRGVLDLIAEMRGATPLDGGHMYVEPTRALVAVDVNTGGDMSPAAGLKANLAAAKALPRALRVRGLGGQVTVDFAPMSKAHRRTLETALKAAFKACPVETSFVGRTPLGHAELQRKRERLPLAAILARVGA